MCVNGWRSRGLLLARTVGRGRGDRRPDAGQPGHLAGQPAQPAAASWARSGGAAARTGRGSCWTGRCEFAEGTGEPPWIAPVRAARAELRWLEGKPDLAAAEAAARAATRRPGGSTRGRSDRWPSGWPGSACGRPARPCPSRTPWRLAGDRRGRGRRVGARSAGPTTRRSPGWARRTRQGCGTRSRSRRPGRQGGHRRGPAADEGSWACGRSRAGPARPPAPPRPG